MAKGIRGTGAVFGAGLLAGIMAGGPLLAGGLAEPAPEPVVVAPVVQAAPSADWTGGWAGARLGYGDASADSAGNRCFLGNDSSYGACRKESSCNIFLTGVFFFGNCSNDSRK